MTYPQDRSLEDRIARLERLVEAIHSRLPPPPATDAPELPAVDTPPAAWSAATEPERRVLPTRRAATARAPWFPWDGEFWLNRLGIGLLLLGVALLFRYSIEQGWLTPEVRVGFGAALGTLLLVLGIRTDPRTRFAAVLSGGGLATFYITGFAAFHLYGLVGYLPAFAGLVAITLGAVWLALHRAAPALAVLGAIGGLGAPLILGISHGTARGFAIYTCGVLAWTAAVYLWRGWRQLLWTAFAGGWLLLALYATGSEELHVVAADRLPVQLAVAFAFLVFGVLPFVRRVAASRAPGAPAPADEPRWTDIETAHWYLLATLPPLFVVGLTAAVWQLPGERWGWLAAAAGAAYLAAAAWQRKADPRLARAFAFSSTFLLPLGALGALSGETLLLALTALALGMHVLAARGGGRGVRFTAHKLFLGLGAWVAFRLLERTGAEAWAATADLAAIAAVFAAAALVPRKGQALAYRLGAHGALLAWLWRALHPLAGGAGLVTVSWGAYGVALLLIAMRTGRPLLERVAISTLLLTVGKLFLVDLAALDALYRVLLFLGIGGAFLGLSYLLPGRWRAVRAEPAAHAAPTEP
jgi:hypothetical protein